MGKFRKIFIFVLAFGICGSLFGCGRQSAGTNGSDNSSASAPSVSTSAEYSNYQDCTVDESGRIIDSKTGEIIANGELAVDSGGNIVWKENKQIVVTWEQVQRNKKSLNSSQITSEKTEPLSTSKKAGSTAANKTSATASSKGAVTSQSTSRSEPTPIEQSKNWDSLYGGNEWMFFTGEPGRQPHEGSAAFVCRFSAGKDMYAAIFVETYCLLDKWEYPVDDTVVLRTFNGQKYVQISACEYKGHLYTFVGSEDIVTLELKCYDATGRNWLTDELKFKRTDNRSLRLISGEYKEFGLKTGDVFTR